MMMALLCTDAHRDDEEHIARVRRRHRGQRSNVNSMDDHWITTRMNNHRFTTKNVNNTQLYHASSSANTIGSPMKFPTTGLSVAATIDAFSSSVRREATSANTSVIKCG